MSDLTPCNYCTLQRVKARAERDGNQVIVKGLYVYVIPKGEDLLPTTEPSIWFMLLPDHCCC